MIVTYLESRARNIMFVLGKCVLSCTFFEIPSWKGTLPNPRMRQADYAFTFCRFCLGYTQHLNLLRKGVRGITVYGVCHTFNAYYALV